MKPIRQQDIKIIDESASKSLIFYAPKGLLLSIQSKRIINLCKKIEAGKIPDVGSSTYKVLLEIFKQGPNPVYRRRTTGFSSIVLNISGHCNFKCPYCFARDGESFSFDDFTSTQAHEVIDYCMTHGPKFDEYTLFFFGGEPLMNFEVMVDAIDYIRSKYNSVKFRYGITTNGSILNDEILKFLKQNNITTLLSFDGLENDRPFVSGVPSTNIVLANMKRLLEYDVPLVLRATLLTTSDTFFENLMYLESLGVNFEFAFAFATSSEETNLSNYTFEMKEKIRSQFDKIIDFYSKALCSNQKIHCLTILEAITEISFKIQSHYACAAGSSMFTFNNNGDIYSCQNNACGKKLSCGNIHTGLAETKRRYSIAPHFSKIDGCSSCWARYLCAGGCLSEKITMGLRKTQNCEEKCDFERMKWSAYLLLTSIVSEKNPTYFERLYKKLENRLTLK